MRQKKLRPVEGMLGGWLWASRSTLKSVDWSALTGVEWTEVVWASKRKPAEKYFEFHARGHASLWLNGGPTCRVCGRLVSPVVPEKRPVRLATWSGDDFSRIDGGPLLVTENGLRALQQLVPSLDFVPVRSGGRNF